MEKRRVRVVKPIHENSVVLVSSIEEGVFKFYTIVGKDLPIIKGTDLYVTGYMTTFTDKNNNKSPTFKVKDFEEILPENEEDIIRYLVNLKLPRLPKWRVKLIVNKYGDETINVLNSDFYAITKIKGIPKNLDKAKERWEQEQYLKLSEKLFEGVGISEGTKKRICKVYKDSLKDVLTSNPFELLKVRGVGFELADTLAKKHLSDYRKDDKRRIKACIISTLLYGRVCGHSFLDFEYIKFRVSEKLGVRTNLKPIINEMVQEDTLRFDNLGENKLAIYLKIDKYEEEAICDKFFALTQKAKNKEYEKEISKIEKELGITLADRQAEAVNMALNNSVCIITGGPGRGKTTVINSVIKALTMKRNVEVKLVAPTGKAARRMSEQTNLPAQTIHSALKIHAINYSEFYNFEVTGENLDADVVIVDECSMIGQSLFSKLLDSISNKTKLILVGDVDQIPSVNSGNVFKEIIASRCIKTCVLDTPFRQSEESNILKNAERINNGMLNLDSGDDFEFIDIKNEKEILDKCLETYLSEVKKRTLDGVWLLTPFRKYGLLGSNTINEKLRDYLNPFNGQDTFGPFRVGDKVMLMENIDGFSNGDTGYFKEILPADDDEPYDRAVIDFGFGKKEFTKDGISKLSLAYASTIHKAQGCECACIIMPEHKMFSKINKRNLVYTGVTRAKEKVYIIGQMDAFKEAVKDNSCVFRNTLIASRLRKRIPVPEYEQQSFNLNRFRENK